jgi:hypothetical protein
MQVSGQLTCRPVSVGADRCRTVRPHPGHRSWSSSSELLPGKLPAKYCAGLGHNAFTLRAEGHDFDSSWTHFSGPHVGACDDRDGVAHGDSPLGVATRQGWTASEFGRLAPRRVLSPAYLRALPPSVPFEHRTNTLFVVFINP